jgi:hypothetical protein
MVDTKKLDEAVVELEKALKIAERVIKLGAEISPCPPRLKSSIEVLSTTQEEAEFLVNEGNYARKYKKTMSTKSALATSDIDKLTKRCLAGIDDLGADCRVVKAHAMSFAK